MVFNGFSDAMGSPRTFPSISSKVGRVFRSGVCVFRDRFEALVSSVLLL